MAASDAGTLPPEVLEARRAREERSRLRFLEDMAPLSSLADFSEWMHQTHLCYAVPRQAEWGEQTEVAPAALASY